MQIPIIYLLKVTDSTLVVGVSDYIFIAFPVFHVLFISWKILFVSFLIGLTSMQFYHLL